MILTLKAAFEEKARRASFYLLGRCALPPEHVGLMAILRSHIGAAERPAYVGHLGASSFPLRLGTAPALGTRKEQLDRLTALFHQACENLGAYGSWWTESFAIIRRTLDVVLPAFPVHIVLLQDVAARAPLEWGECEFEAWMGARRARWGHLDDELLVVGRDSALAPFIDSRFSRALTLTDWLMETPTRQAGIATGARIEVSRHDGKDLPEYRTLAPVANTVLSLPDQCIIDVLRPDPGWPAELDVAEFDGISEDQLVVKTTWNSA